MPAAPNASDTMHRIRTSRRLTPWLGLLCICCALMSSGCGYALAGRGSFLPDYIRTIGVPTFTNRTTVFNLETQITEKVRSEFIGRGQYQILPDANNVDAVLIGEVTGATPVPVGLDAQQLATRYEITMTARVELRDVRANRVLWENPAVILRQDYPAQNAQAGPGPVDPAAFFGQDQNALDRITTEFARTIVSAILEAF
jgi:hypothetical protein